VVNIFKNDLEEDGKAGERKRVQRECFEMDERKSQPSDPATSSKLLLDSS